MTSGNNLWDCPTMISSTAQITIQQFRPPSPPTAFTVTSASNLTLANKPKESASVSAVYSSTNEQPVAGEEIPQPIPPHTVDLLTAPNPAEAQVGLRFRLPGAATVTVEIVDALQRVVLQPLIAEERTEGEHELAIPVGTLPSGVYSVRVRARVTNGRTLVQQRPLIIAR